MEYRFDRAKLSKHFKTDAGALIVPAKLTKVGIFTYKNPDGSERKELRLPEEVFSAKSLESLAGNPVTIGHPGIVDPTNWRGVAVGHIREAKQDGEFISATLRIDDAHTIRQVEDKKLQDVSCGYVCDYDDTPGTWNGQRYDGIQKNIRQNHLALLPENGGRAGPECRLTLDGKEYLSPVESSNLKVGMDPKELEALLKRAVTAEAEAQRLQGRCDALETENADLKKTHQDADDIDALVESRSELVASAKSVLGKDFLSKGKSNLEVKQAIVAKLDPKRRLDGKSEEYVDGVFEVLMSKSSRAQEETAKAKTVLDATGAAEGKDLIAEARQRMIERNAKVYDKHLRGKN